MARALAGAIEPFAGQVYFAPECHELYTQLGFGPSPGERHGVALPDGAAYFLSRGSLLGQVPGDVVAAAFAVFDPDAVRAAVAYGWSLTDAPTIEDARTQGALGQLRRILGDAPDGVDRARALLERAGGRLRPEGKPLFAGLLALHVPDSALGATWRLADRLREYRGDAHTAAWTSAGIDAVEIGLLTELYWGLPLRSYIRTRAWSDDALDAGIARLERRGWVRDGALTDHGRDAREQVELATDVQCRPVVESLGDDGDELVGLMGRMSSQIRAQYGYPAAGPHDMARTARA
ncbi:MAG: SCO6745 family protein [Acidimicrobiales bacterium]